MFQAIESFQQFVYHVPIVFGLCALCYLYLHKLLDKTIQENGLNIHLINVEVKKGGNSKQNSKDHELYNNNKDLIIIYCKLLEVAFDNLSSFKSSNSSIYIEFYLIYLLLSKSSMSYFHLILMY